MRRYGQPAIAGAATNALRAAGATRILVLPAYPQYSGTTTASLVDAVNAWSARQRHVPELRFVNRYHDDRGYLQALAHRIERHWREHGRPDHLLMSFHGVPQRTLQLGDPYHCRMPHDRHACWPNGCSSPGSSTPSPSSPGSGRRSGWSPTPSPP